MAKKSSLASLSCLPIVLLMTLSSSRFCSALSAQLLKGKRVLVTGGGRGIGRAIALICHGEGADVVVTSRTRSELEETVRLARTNEAGGGNDDGSTQKQRLEQSAMAATLLSRRGGRSSTGASGRATSVGARRAGAATKARTGRSSVSRLVEAVKTGSSSMASQNSPDTCDDGGADRMTFRVCDVTDEAQVDSMVRDIVNGDGGGEIDILINNAGGSQSPKGPVGTLESRKLEDLLKLNVIGPQLVTSAMCRHAPGWTPESEAEEMPASEQKVVLNVSSKAGRVGLRNYSFYAATKFALEGLTSSWSKELAGRNVRVHSLSPGMVDTRSFPKPPGKEGVRDASSIGDCLLLALTGSVPSATTSVVVGDMMDYTGHYIHVDEFDEVVKAKGVENAHLAWKAIDEDPFQV